MMAHSCGNDGKESRVCCDHSAASQVGVRQSLSEMEFERGIWYAAQSNDLDRVKHLLMEKGIPVDTEDSAGYTALHYAARGGYFEMIEMLLKNGANPNAVTGSGRATPLHRSSMRGMNRVVELLLNHGAEPNIRDSDGYTALHRGVLADSQTVCRLLIPVTDLSACDNNSRTALQLAREKNNQVIIDQIESFAKSAAR